VWRRCLYLHRRDDDGEQVSQVRKQAAEMLSQQAKCWTQELRPLLAEHHIQFLEPADFTPAITQYFEGYFTREIRPVLTPLAFDPGHPFPYISNLSLNLAVVVKHGGRTKFARRCPTCRDLSVFERLTGRRVVFRTSSAPVISGTTVRAPEDSTPTSVIQEDE
jgi:polyphosphate kinase